MSFCPLLCYSEDRETFFVIGEISMKAFLKNTLTVLLAFFILLAGVLAVQWFHQSDPESVIHYETDNNHIHETTQISAHRSGAGIMPEETMMAFKNCVENQGFLVDIFEFDLHITKDGVLVLLHDDDLDRTSDSEEVFGEKKCRPEDKTYEELRQLNMGAKFETDEGEMPYAGLKGDEVPEDLRILALDDLLNYLESKGTFTYIIEIKNDGDLGKKGADILYRTLVERNMLDRVIFGTFHDEIASYVEETYPDMTRGASPKEVAGFLFAALTGSEKYSPKCKVLQLPYKEGIASGYVNFGTTFFINYAHKNNLAVQYWTINKEEEVRYLISIGADCVMSDYPDVAYQIREKMD